MEGSIPVAKNNGDVAVPAFGKNAASTGGTVQDHAPSRLTIAQVLPGMVFPVLGCILYLVGKVPVVDIVALLGSCCAIGAVVTLIVSGGRRLANAAGVALAQGLAHLTSQQ